MPLTHARWPALHLPPVPLRDSGVETSDSLPVSHPWSTKACRLAPWSDNERIVWDYSQTFFCTWPVVWGLKRKDPRGWRDGSVFMSTGCSLRGPGFGSQHLHGSPKPSVISISGGLTSLCSDLLRHQAHMVLRHICKQILYTLKTKFKQRKIQFDSFNHAC